MSLSRRHLLLGALPALAACSVLPDRPYVEVSRFPLAPRRQPVLPLPGKGKVVLVRLMRAAPGLDQRGLRSIRADGTEKVDYYAEWAAPPVEAAEEGIRRWLGDCGLFAGIVSPGTRARYDLVLEAELSELVADLKRREARARLSVLLLQESGLGGRVLVQATPAGQVPLGEGEAAPMLAQAMVAALGQALAGMESAIRPYA